jgi:hypothetical protein
MDVISWQAWALRQDEATLTAARILWRALGPLKPVEEHPLPLCIACGGLNTRRYGDEGRPTCSECGA